LNLNAALDVAIGLVLLYLMLSLLCTVINEMLSSLVSLRAATLAQGLQRLIDDTTLKAAFSNHGLIGGSTSVAGAKPPSYLAGRTFALALLSSLDPAKPVPVIGDIQQAAQQLPDSNIRDMLLAELSVCSGDLVQLRDGVAHWFDNEMDRLGGVYKRNMKRIALIVGLGIAVALNADTIAVTHALWRDGTLRSVIMQNASTVAASSGGTPAAAVEALRPLPLGWPCLLESCYTAAGAPGSDAAFWLSKCAGLLITGLALSLGAPFWFDVLSKFVNMRSSGPKPARTEDTT
jgi:hypothetical protein